MWHERFGSLDACAESKQDLSKSVRKETPEEEQHIFLQEKWRRKLFPPRHLKLVRAPRHTTMKHPCAENSKKLHSLWFIDP